MSFDQNNRIAHFLSVYATTADTGEPIPPTAKFIKAAVKMILNADVMTAEEMRRKALADYNVIIPADFFPDEERET